jgi:hypothetical protein
MWWAKSTMGIRSFSLRSNRIRKMKIGLNQLLVCISPFSPFSTHFYVPFFKSVAKRTLLRYEKCWRGIWPSPSYVRACAVLKCSSTLVWAFCSVGTGALCLR